MGFTEITKEQRPVLVLIMESRSWVLGVNGITKIEPYDETGEMACVPWFNVWQGERLICKVNAAFVHRVEY